MLLLSRQDVQSLLTMKDAIRAVEEAFKQFALGNIEMPIRSSISIEQNKGIMLTMPAYIAGDMNALGQKTVTVYAENPSRKNLPTILAMVQLLDPETGECLAVMDGAFLTAMRTGAASGVATKYLARTNSSTVAVFGAGVQAETQLEAMAEVRRIKAAKVFDTVTQRVIQYCERMSKRLKIDVEQGTSPRDTLRGADIVICASTSRVPLFNGEWLELGMHVNGIGSHTPDTREIDTTAVRRAKVIVDSLQVALREAGDLIIPIAERAISFEHIWSELGDVVLGRKKGRTSDQEITLFKSVGLAIQDISTALIVYNKAIEQNKGTRVDI